ncbi:Protein TusC [Marinomonas spartinae]|uniref:Protein TusC n=1 Tax=Marinomonas spartinae TaxID=1792290 RepID=A0A1A8TB90_9GAMM|nr:DsrE family protein [Marinomonas spartinae]SBS27393.1 Protein TusC [Marinomonas spartinae]SBS28837.1 Protein TusC [Marinomonas spartinae]
MKKTLIHLTTSPYTGLACKEGLDLALVLGTFEQQVDICLSDAAIALLFVNQDPSSEHGKQLHKLLDGLEFYDINNVFIENNKLTNKTEIWPNTHALSKEEWHSLFSKYEHVFRF